MKKELTEMNECYECKNCYPIPGSCHVGCSMPSEDIKGEEWGIKNGWFIYPYCFDPVWKKNKCHNFQQK